MNSEYQTPPPPIQTLMYHLNVFCQQELHLEHLPIQADLTRVWFDNVKYL